MIDDFELSGGAELFADMRLVERIVLIAARFAIGFKGGRWQILNLRYLQKSSLKTQGKFIFAFIAISKISISSGKEFSWNKDCSLFLSRLSHFKSL